MNLKDNFSAILGLLVVLGFEAVTIILCFHSVPENSQDIVMAMTGVLATATAGVVGYHYGSSAGSAKKTEIMAKQNNGNGGTP